MISRSQLLMVCVLALAMFGGVSAAAQLLPPPQIAAADGKPAPDFTLSDQDGKPFHLASLRGQRVLLVFYRGYW